MELCTLIYQIDVQVISAFFRKGSDDYGKACSNVELDLGFFGVGSTWID